MSRLCIPAVIITYADTIGTVTGDGVYDNGVLVTMTAVAHNGFKFLHWSENETVLSTNSTYSFNISDNRSIKAYFTTI